MSDGQVLRSDAAGYSATARALHWTTAAIVLFLIPAGFLMTNMPEGAVSDVVYNLHKSFGAVLIPLVAFRLAYRLTHTPPPLPADIPAIQRFAAEATHWLLYILVALQPILGWVASSAYRAPVPVFGLFDLPPIWPENQAFSEKLFLVHKVVGFSIGALLVAHIGGALFHHFVRRDTVLLRMLRG